jgi:hypothetical protein
VSCRQILSAFGRNAVSAAENQALGPDEPLNRILAPPPKCARGWHGVRPANTRRCRPLTPSVATSPWIAFPGDPLAVQVLIEP